MVFLTQSLTQKITTALCDENDGFKSLFVMSEDVFVCQPIVNIFAKCMPVRENCRQYLAKLVLAF